MKDLTEEVKKPWIDLLNEIDVYIENFNRNTGAASQYIDEPGKVLEMREKALAEINRIDEHQKMTDYWRNKKK